MQIYFFIDLLISLFIYLNININIYIYISTYQYIYIYINIYIYIYTYQYIYIFPSLKSYIQNAGTCIHLSPPQWWQHCPSQAWIWPTAKTYPRKWIDGSDGIRGGWHCCRSPAGDPAKIRVRGTHERKLIKATHHQVKEIEVAQFQSVYQLLQTRMASEPIQLCFGIVPPHHQQQCIIGDVEIGTQSNLKDF